MKEVQYSNPKKALLIIDIQEDYTGINAKKPFPYKDSEKFITKLNKLVHQAQARGILVVYIRQEFESFLGKTLSKLIGHGTAIKGNPGAEFDKRLDIVSNHCFTKPMPDAFTNPSLGLFLEGQQVKELYLVGLDAAGCVHYTAKGALKRGYAVSIVKDGILLLAEHKWDSLLKKFEQEGYQLVTSEDIF